MALCGTVNIKIHLPFLSHFSSFSGHAEVDAATGVTLVLTVTVSTSVTPVADLPVL